MDIQDIKDLMGRPAPVRAPSCDLLSLPLPTSQLCSAHAAFMLSVLTSGQSLQAHHGMAHVEGERDLNSITLTLLAQQDTHNHLILAEGLRYQHVKL